LPPSCTDCLAILEASTSWSLKGLSGSVTVQHVPFTSYYVSMIGKLPLGRPRRRWEENNKMDLQEVGGGRGDWMELAQDRDRWLALVGTVRNFRVP
jgi:hypothetical protein